MMSTYTAPALTAKTPKSDQDKLVAALKGVTGVEAATLRPDSNQFEIEARPNQAPKRDEITAAANEAGFPVNANEASVKK